MATISIPTDPAEALELAQELTEKHGAAVITRSEPGVGLVYVVPDDDSEPEPKPEPKTEKPAAAAKKAPAASKPAAAGAAATD